jgi:DNA-binding MarR family transcriptional regulator
MIRKNVGIMEERAVSLAPRVAAELMKISRMLARGDRPLSRSGRRRIGPTQGRILAFLLDRSHDPVTLTSLAEGVALSPATTSEAVRGLGLRGFVRKARSRGDARVVYLSLSAAGRRMAQEVASGDHSLSAAIGKLTSMEQELFLRTLKHIQEAMAPGAER